MLMTVDDGAAAADDVPVVTGPHQQQLKAERHLNSASSLSERTILASYPTGPSQVICSWRLAAPQHQSGSSFI
jgi:hypothetical protein